MIDPKNNVRSKPNNSAQPESLTKNNAAVTLGESAVRTRAHELYELRGRTDGRAEQDWYEAEADVAANKGSETNERKSFSKGA